MTETSPATSSTETADPQDVDTTPCSECAHPVCRTRRASHQPRLRGRTAEFAAEHRTATAVQTRHPDVVVWFGEATQSYWAATPTGLTGAADSDALLLALWHDGHGAAPAAEDAEPTESAGAPESGVVPDTAGVDEPTAAEDSAERTDPASAVAPIGGPVTTDVVHSGPLPVVTVDTAEAVLA